MKCSSVFAISCLAACMTVAAATAHAEDFTFNATGLSFSGSGTLTAVADPTLADVLDITAISGTINGVAITGLLPCVAYDPSTPCSSSGNSFRYDNLLYPDGVPTGIQDLDIYGLGFALASGLDGDFYAYGTHQYEFTLNAPHDNGQVVGFSISPVPEPGCFLLLGSGLLGLTGIVSRRNAGRERIAFG